jgi:hypothetical protein
MLSQKLAVWAYQLTHLRTLQQDTTASGETELSDPTLTPEQDILLFQMLGKAVQRATGSLHIPGHRAQKPGSKQKKVMEEFADEITELFIKKLPELFAKFGAEPAKAAVLVELPQAFNLESEPSPSESPTLFAASVLVRQTCAYRAGVRLFAVYGTSRSMAQFNATLKHIMTVFSKSSDSEFLRMCSDTLEFLCDNEFPLAQKAEAAVQSLITTAVDSIDAALEEGGWS